MKGTVKILDSTGHTPIAFDTDKGVVAEAENILASTVSTHNAVFDAKTKEQVPRNEVISDPSKVLGEHEELIVVPPMAGG